MSQWVLAPKGQGYRSQPSCGRPGMAGSRRTHNALKQIEGDEGDLFC